MDVLVDARCAAAERDWQAVHLLLAGVETDDAAPVDALDLRAEAAWWLGQLDECIRIRERAYAELDRAGDGVGAARLAMLLSDNHVFGGRRAVASGWLQRARRLLTDQPLCLQHGCLALREGEQLHGHGELERAAARFEDAIARAREFANADLEADGLQAMGRLLITQQRPAEGLALLDEAMLAAAQGRLGSYMTGKVYCSLMSACEELGDMARVVEWSEEAARWAADHGVAVFPGLCRVHRAEVLCYRGSWREAEAEATLACGELASVHRPNAAAAYHALGEIRRRLGDLPGAETAFARAEELGGDAQPGLALLRLAQDRVAVAAAAIDRAARARAWNQPAKAKLLPAYVQVLVAAGEVDAAADAAEELAAIARVYGSAALRGDALVARGRVELGRGDHDAARRSLHAAIEQHRSAESPYELAVTRVLLARACCAGGDVDGATAQLAIAIEAFHHLGARRDVSDASALQRQLSRPPLVAGGLTERECEVLRLVAAGLTNRETATELGVSEKTVARHLSNIFTKAGVSSRAAATAYAFEAGVIHRGAGGGAR